MIENPDQTIILDPGLKGPHGHHPIVDRLLLQGFKAQKIPVRLLVNREAEEGVVLQLKAEPVLSPVAYVKSSHDGHKAQSLLNQTNNAFLTELKKELTTRNSLILLHTATQWQMFGLHEWFRNFDDGRSACNILLRFPPVYSHLKDDVTAWFTEFSNENWRKILKLWRPFSDRVNFFAEAEETANAYQKLGDVDITLLPMSIDFDALDTAAIFAEGELDEPPLFAFAGATRLEKGIELLSAAIDQYIDGGGQGRFTFHSFFGAPHKVSERLKQLAPQVTCRNERLSNADYFKFLTNSDAVLMPYDPKQYNVRTSQVFWETLGAGRPVIVSAGSWMAKQLATLERPCGMIAEHTPRGFVAALTKFEAQRELLSNGAQAVAQAVRQRHNSKLFLRLYAGQLLQNGGRVENAFSSKSASS